MKLCVIALALLGLAAADVSHLQPKGYNYDPPASASASYSDVLPGGDSSSYQPAHLIPQHLKAAAHVESAPAEVVVGGDSSSYQPEHLIPQHLKAAHEEAASAEVVPGGDSSSYQPEHLIPQGLTAEVSAAEESQSFNLGADTQTPEQFIPEADRIAHYIHSQGQAVLPTPAPAAQVIPGGDSSSYQPEHLIPQHLEAAHEEAASAEVVPGGDSSSYQPEHLIPQGLTADVAAAEESQSFNLGADTQTPEQFIPEADRVADYIHSQGQAVLPTPAPAAQVIPGGDSSSYQPEHLIPQHLQAVHAQQAETVAEEPVPYNFGADTQTPEQFIPEADRIAHEAYVQEQAPVAIGANTITPAHLYQEPTSNGIEEFNPETHIPQAIGRDTITPAHLKAGSGASVSASSSSSSSNYGTQYGSNGGYVY